MTDAAELQRSRAGDPAAFGALVERYQGLVWSISFGCTGDEALSEDITQEAFMILWRRLAEIVSPDKIRPFVAGVARNLARNARRRRGNLATPYADEISDGALTPLEVMLAQESLRLLDEALRGLDDDAREALILFYREDQSTEEVARVLGLSTAATRKRLSRARGTLRTGVERLIEARLSKAVRRGAIAGAVVAAVIAETSAASAASLAAAQTARGQIGLRGVISRRALLGLVAAAGAAIAIVVAMRSSGDLPSTAVSVPAAVRDLAPPVATSARIDNAAAPARDPARDDEPEPAATALWSAQPLVTGRLVRAYPEVDANADGVFSEDEILAASVDQDARIADAIAMGLAADLDVSCWAVWFDPLTGAHEIPEYFDMPELRAEIEQMRADGVDLDEREIIASLIARRERPDRLCAPLDVGRAWASDRTYWSYEDDQLGIAYLPMNDGGLFVTQVLPFSPGRGKLRRGDVITGANGVVLAGGDHLRSLVAGSVASLEVERGDSSVEIEVDWRGALSQLAK